MGVFDPHNVPLEDTTPDDVPIDQLAMDYIARSGKSWDFSLWDAFADVPALLARYQDAVQRFMPNVVQLEHPYLWPVVRALRDRGRLQGVAIIYSSHNFEAEYLRELAEISGNVSRELLRWVARQEEEIARDSDLVVAVSDADASSFRRIGARRVVVARNGGRRVDAATAAVDALDGYLGKAPFALFVSSAHPPNARGLLDLAEGLASPLPGLLIICGGIGTLLEPHRRSVPLIREARMLGVVDPPILDALLLRASAIVLPKTRGGGSNLKTSEALLTGRPVVATSQAFVGFEPWAGAPSVTIEDNPTLFWQHVARHLNRAPTSLAPNDGQCDGLLWPACLASLVTAVQDLVNASSRRAPLVHRKMAKTSA